MSNLKIFGNKTEFFTGLTPQMIDQAILQMKLRPIGQVLALNSLENRVYEVEIAEQINSELPCRSDRVVVKFYRPGRWNKESILAEHHFLQTLEHYEVPVLTPLEVDGQTLHQLKESGLFFSIYPRISGRLKDELNDVETEQIGRLVGRVHNIGRELKLKQRPLFNTQNFIEAHINHIQKAQISVGSLIDHYLLSIKHILPVINNIIAPLKSQAIHGDLHRGNILWTNQGPWLLDFDDCLMGPIEQDLWLLFPGRDQESLKQRSDFIESYNFMTKSNVYLSSKVIEALRTIRMIHFNGWISLRYHDPIFKTAYAHFDTHNYWEQAVLDLKEQLSILS
jgi:Ser/Thr protein kinase RdoA (MazF antagonist)